MEQIHSDIAEPHSKQPPQIAISSIEEYLRLEKLYKEAGKPFNPAIVEGSPAACHILAQHQLQQGERCDPGDKICFASVGIGICLVAG
jgi:hypothetical protein